MIWRQASGKIRHRWPSAVGRHRASCAPPGGGRSAHVRTHNKDTAHHSAPPQHHRICNMQYANTNMLMPLAQFSALEHARQSQSTKER
eukprot:scaffold33457_cov90-Isochrysis_galbana.AAC.2